MLADRRLALEGATEEEDGNLIDVPPEVMKQALSDNGALIEFFVNIENGLIHLTASDYLNLPAPVKDAWMVWKANRPKK